MPNCILQFCVSNIREKRIVFGRIRAIIRVNTVDVSKFTALFSLLLVVVGEIGLWINLRNREPSSDRIVTRRTGIRGSHCYDAGLRNLNMFVTVIVTLFS